MFFFSGAYSVGADRLEMLGPLGCEGAAPLHPSPADTEVDS